MFFCRLWKCQMVFQKVIFHSLSKLLLHPSFHFYYCRSWRLSGLAVLLLSWKCSLTSILVSTSGFLGCHISHLLATAACNHFCDRCFDHSSFWLNIPSTCLHTRKVRSEVNVEIISDRVCLGLSDLPSNLALNGDLLTAQVLSSLECRKQVSWNSNKVDHWPLPQGSSRTLRHLLKLEHSVRYGQSMTSTEV